MIEWSAKEVATCTAYGLLWLVVKIERGHMLCYRVRKRKGLLYVSSENKLFKHMPRVEPGALLFRDKGGKVAHLMPEGEFAEQLKQTMEKLL